MRRLAFSMLGCIAGLALAAYLLPGVSYTEVSVVVLMGAVLGLVYTILRPLVKTLTLPLRILTLGLLNIVIDAGLLWLVAEQFQGFTIESFGLAVVSAFLVNLCRSIVRSVIR